MTSFFVSTATLAFLAAGFASADVKITANYNNEGKSSETTIYSNGTRLRYEYAKGLVLLRQCDLKRMVDVDDKAKTYMVLPVEPATPPSADSTAPASKEVVTDTNEHKDMFGYPARHLKITKAADGKSERTETDGWYIDLKGMDPCSQTQAAAGNGYPVAYTINTYGENGKPTSTVSMKVTALVTAPVDGMLFEVPRGYTESTPQSAVTAASAKATSKAPGVVRIGTVPMLNQSAQALPVSATYTQLMGQLQTAQLEVIPLAGDSPDAIQQKAKESECDYVLFTALTTLERPNSGKVGGFLHKAPGIGHITGGDAMEARVAYRLVPGAGGAPVLDASVLGKNGSSFDWKAAALLASNVLPMTMAARMMGGAFNPSMMSAMMSGRGSGGAMTSMDPMMGSLTMLLRSTNMAGMAGAAGAAGNPGQNPPGADIAIAAALDQVGKAVIAQLKPPAK